MKILLTDDQQMFRYAFVLLLKTMVEPASVIEEAASGEEALEKLSDNSFDLLFLDISMPGMNGITVCEHLYSSVITTPGKSLLEKGHFKLIFNIFQKIKLFVYLCDNKNELRAKKCATQKISPSKKIKFSTPILTC